MKTARIAAHVLSLMAFGLLVGCVTPDPLKGWKFRTFDDYSPPYDRHHYHLDQAITDDCQDFIAKNKLISIGAITGFYDDGAGQHGVVFDALSANQNASWHFVLIYNKDGKRIKVMKYGYRRFES